MKKVMCSIVVLLLVTLTYAGSIDNLDYKDKAWFRDRNRQVDDHDVFVDADTVNGQDVTTEIDNVNNEITSINIGIMDYYNNKDLMLVDTFNTGTGFSQKSLGYNLLNNRSYFYNNEPGQFVKDLDNKYLQQQDKQELIEHIIKLEKQLYDISARVYALEQS